MVDRLQRGSRRVLLSFSGKDSLAAWLYLRDNNFEVVPYWCYSVPGLSFDDEMISYYEDYFQTHIYRFLHPISYALINYLSFQPPDAASAILRMHIPRKVNYAFIERQIIDALGMPTDTFTAVGIRARDNLMRNRLVHQMGPLGLRNRRYWWTVWDFSIDDVMQIIRRHAVKLSRAYAIFGATGDILDYPVLRIMRDQCPDDFARVVQMFPLIEAELFRYEGVK